MTEYTTRPCTHTPSPAPAKKEQKHKYLFAFLSPHNGIYEISSNRAVKRHAYTRNFSQSHINLGEINLETGCSLPQRHADPPYDGLASPTIPRSGAQSYPVLNSTFFSAPSLPVSLFLNRPDHCTKQSRTTASEVNIGRIVHALNQLAYAALLPIFRFVHYSDHRTVRLILR